MRKVNQAFPFIFEKAYFNKIKIRLIRNEIPNTVKLIKPINKL